jgi:hypothetical protein
MRGEGMIAQEDTELLNWLLGIYNHIPTQPSAFLEAVGDAALRADWENYEILRPALLELKKKYPDYGTKF